MSETTTKESSLTAPEDRNREKRWRPEQGAPPLTEQEVDNAMSELNVTAFVEKFPRKDRTYADPPPPLQKIGLVSFVPAKGATPNDNGVYGYAKLRGNYDTGAEADQRAEFLVRNVDSYHSIFHCYVGRPFPLTESSKYSEETTEIDIRRQTAESVSSSIKEKKQREQREIEEVKEREDQLKEDVSKDVTDPYDLYITLKVKKAQLVWSWFEHQKKMEETKDIIMKTREQIQELDTDNPDFEQTYLDKYKQARKDAGIKETEKETSSNFMKYLVEEAELPF